MMNFRTLIPITLLAIGLVAGCSGGEATTTVDPAASTTAGATTVAETAKCAGCSKEVAKAELVSHDGSMMCKDCVAAHNH